MIISRILSAIAAAAYITIAFFTVGFEAAFKIGMFLIFPMACIWFSDAMGRFTGVMMGRSAITGKTPGFMVAAGGWLLLLLPIIMGVIIAASGGG